MTILERYIKTNYMKTEMCLWYMGGGITMEIKQKKTSIPEGLWQTTENKWWVLSYLSWNLYGE